MLLFFPPPPAALRFSADLERISGRQKLSNEYKNWMLTLLRVLGLLELFISISISF